MPGANDGMISVVSKSAKFWEIGTHNCHSQRNLPYTPRSIDGYIWEWIDWRNAVSGGTAVVLRKEGCVSYKSLIRIDGKGFQIELHLCDL